MSNAERIEQYAKDLSRALTKMMDADREDIVAEIRAHLTHRADEDRLDEALAALGTPQICARGFLEELKLQDAYTDGSPGKTFGALLALASRRTTAAFGLFFSGLFFLMAAGFAISGIVEIVAPSFAGLWVDAENNFLVFGAVDVRGNPTAAEVLGRWMIPASAGLAVVSLLIGQWLGGFFLQLMIGKNRPGAL